MVAYSAAAEEAPDKVGCRSVESGRALELAYEEETEGTAAAEVAAALEADILEADVEEAVVAVADAFEGEVVVDQEVYLVLEAAEIVLADCWTLRPKLTPWCRQGP